MQITKALSVLAIATVALVAFRPAQAQQYFVSGKPATATEVAFLQDHGFGPGNWRMDGWGIGPAEDSLTMKLTVPVKQCHYVLDVPLDCAIVVASR